MELLHTATLVHDDVVDDSMERRGFFSINALWKNKIAVLIGDFFALSWVGMWQGLSLPTTNRAIGATMIRVMVLPWSEADPAWRAPSICASLRPTLHS